MQSDGCEIGYIKRYVREWIRKAKGERDEIYRGKVERWDI